MAAQRAATNNIIRIEMMGEKSKPIRMKQNVEMVAETSMDVLISRTAASDEQKDKSWEEDLKTAVFKEGSPALKALE